MKKLIEGLVRDTSKLQILFSRTGNPDDCYSTYNHICIDNIDKSLFLWHGNYWSGLGPDSLDLLTKDQALAILEAERWDIDNPTYIDLLKSL